MSIHNMRWIARVFRRLGERLNGGLIIVEGNDGFFLLETGIDFVHALDFIQCLLDGDRTESPRVSWRLFGLS